MGMWLERFLGPDNFWQAWEKVAANRGCAGVDRQTIDQFGRRTEGNLLNLLQQVAQGSYRPLPLRRIAIPKKGNGWRILRVPTVRDRIVQQALLNVLHPILDAQFEPVSFAYRPGRSHRLAVEQVTAWHRRGYDWLVDADILSYFDQVEHERLLVEVAERLVGQGEKEAGKRENQGEFARVALQLIEQWTTVPTLTPAGLVLPERGIPQGAVVSPILANVYLDDFDQALQDSRFKLVRFADDFVVLGKSQTQVEQAQIKVAELLNSIGLQLHPDKTDITNFDRGFRFLGHAFVGDVVVPVKRSHPIASRARVEQSPLRIVHADTPANPSQMQQALLASLKTSQQPIPPPLFVVLGYAVRPDQTVEIKSSEVIWNPGMSTLYLIQQGTTVHKEQGRFLLRAPQNQTIEIPIREVEQILVFGNCQLTTQVISVCLDQRITVVYLTQMGDYKGHLWSAEAAGIMPTAAQFERHQDEGFRLETARAIVTGKLENSKQLLLRLNRKRKLEAVAAIIQALYGDLEAVAAATEINSLRGHEGAAAARYFKALGQLITNPGFVFNGRNRRPPTDPTNSLLSFGYTLLHNHVLSLILAEGLNPYLGNLHGSERKQTFLAFDLVEEFRSVIVDALVMRLVNRKSISPTDFSWPNEQGGVYLQGAGRRLFLQRFEDRLSQPVSHPDIEGMVSYRRVLQLQVRRYKQAVLTNTTYSVYKRPN